VLISGSTLRLRLSDDPEGLRHYKEAIFNFVTKLNHVTHLASDNCTFAAT
jgi:hypothetical protein